MAEQQPQQQHQQQKEAPLAPSAPTEPAQSASPSTESAPTPSLPQGPAAATAATAALVPCASPLSPATSPAAAKPKRHRLTYEQKIQILTLRRIGWTYAKIAAELSVTQRGVQLACTNPAPPVKQSGRPWKLTAEQREQVLLFVARPGNQALSYSKVKEALGLECSPDSIRRFLKAHGVQRRTPGAKRGGMGGNGV